MSNYPDDYQDHWFDVEPECPGCERHQDDKDFCAKYVEELVQILYSDNEHINIFKVHSLLEEIAAYTGAKFDVEHLPPIVRINKMGQELYNITSDKIKAQ